MIRAALLLAFVLAGWSGAQIDQATDQASEPAADASVAAPRPEADTAPTGAAAQDDPRAGQAKPRAAPRGEVALARRLSDSVAVRIGPQRLERVLYYFSPTAELAVGDELEQGSGGHSEIGLPEGGRVQLHSTAHLIVQALGVQPGDPEAPDGGDVLVLPLLTKASITSLTRPLTVVVPGGANCIFQGTEIEVWTEPGRILVRNQGGLPVEVRGFLSIEKGTSPRTGLSGVGSIVLDRGQQVVLPLFRLLPVGRGVRVSEWNRLTLRHSGGWELADTPESIRVGRPELPAEAGSEVAARRLDDLTIQGVRTRALPGEALVVANHRREVADPLLSLGDLEPDSVAGPGAGAGVPMSNQALLEAVRQGISLERLRVDGYEITQKMYDKVLEVVERQKAQEAAKAAKLEQAQQAKAADTEDTTDTPTQNPQDDQP